MAVERIRDAERSRKAILDAAETLFAEHGYDGASLHDIAVAAGLSRGTPSYFFGAKGVLYLAVLDRAFAVREAATRAAFVPVHEWCAGQEGHAALRRALASAADDYMNFLAGQPSFVRLVMQEELAGASRLKARRRTTTAIQDAFEALRRQGPRRGLRRFQVQEAILLFIALTFAPISYRNTLMRAVERDLDDPAGRREQVRLAVDQLMHLLVRSGSRAA